MLDLSFELVAETPALTLELAISQMRIARARESNGVPSPCNEGRAWTPATLQARAIGRTVVGTLSLVLTTSTSHADESSRHQLMLACAHSFEQAQRLRNASHYIAASEEAVKCASESCGQALFDECTKIYSELQTATPSVVCAAHDDTGNELTRVTVSVDGEPAAEQLDGKPIQLDPGHHVFSFTKHGVSAIHRKFLIRAGEQFRAINVVFGSATPARSDAVTIAPKTKTPEPAAHSSSPPLASLILGGVSVVGLGAFVGFRLAGFHSFDALSGSCRPTCTTSQVDGVREKYVISDVALGVGLAAAAAALTLYFVVPGEDSHETALQLGPTSQGVSARVSGRF